MRRVPGRLLLAALLALAPLAAFVAGGCASEDVAQTKPAEAATAVSAQQHPFVLTDRTVKLRMLRTAKQPPRILIFGGSRATRIEPAYFRELTGLTGFNLALQNGRPEDAWAFVNYLHRRFPKKPLQVVWLIHVEAFRQQGLSAGLVQEKQLSRWFPPSLIAAERTKLPKTKAELPPGRDLALTEFGPDGVVRRNRYDTAEERGRPLSRGVDYSIKVALERYRTTTPALFPRSQRYFEKTIRLLDKLGTTQIVVLAPLQPRLMAAVRDAGWSERHAEVMDYLKAVQRKDDFRLLDCSDLTSIEGDPENFYDGFHIKSANARRLIRTIVGAFPKAFDGGGAGAD